MSPTKTQVEPQTKAAPATATAKQPALPEKQGGPARLGLVQRAAASALPPPDGQPSAARAGEMIADQGQMGAPGRARMASGLQRSVGNAQLSRMAMPGSLTPTVSQPGHGALPTPAPASTKGSASSATTSVKPSGTSPVMRMPIQRQCACGGGTGPEGECTACEAKRVNRQASGMPTIQRKCACGGDAGHDGECAECKAKGQAVQRQATESAAPNTLPRSATSAIQSGAGQPLDRATRDSTKQTDNEIKKPSIQAKLVVGPPGDKFEQEADAAASQITTGRKAGQISRLPGGIAQSLCEQEENLQKKSGPEEISASPDIESRLVNSKGSGSPLPSTIREQMESTFDADFSNVRIHTSSTAVGMNKDLHAQAFTHGSDIYFNSGKFDTSSQSGKHLLAHELTHTVQQQGGSARRKIQRWPDWVSDAAGWVSDTASDVADTVVEGAEAVGGAVVDGARWVGGKVADGAGWVVDQVSAAAQWVIDQIRSAINAGKDYLTEKWERIKEFGRTCFDDIKNGFGNLAHFVTAPLSGFMTALSMMNADLLVGIWDMVKTGANALWAGINSVINGVLQIGRGIWDTVSGFINGIFGTIEGLFSNAAFDLLPDFIKSEARSILNGLRSLWNQVSTFWTGLWQQLTSSVQGILAGVRSFVDNVIGFSIDGVLNMVRGLKEVYDYVIKFFKDPRATIQPLLDQLAAKLNTEVPPRANAKGNQMAQATYPGGAAPATAHGNIQRQASDSEDRDTASLDEVGRGIIYYIAQFWAELDIKQMLWQTVVNTFWPPATIEAIGKEFSDLWNDHWATTVASLYTPRNFFDYPLGCLHDIWSNFLILLDFPLSLWRTLNHVVGLLMGYITIIVVLVEAILGGVAAVEVGIQSLDGQLGYTPGYLPRAPLGDRRTRAAPDASAGCA